MNSNITDINSLLTKITDNHEISHPETDQISHLRKEENSNRLYKILPLERDKNLEQKPIGTISTLNRNFDLKEQVNTCSINERMQNFEPLCKNSYKVYDFKPEISTKRNSYKNQDVFSNNPDTNNRSNNFNRMIFNSKRDDSNEKFQSYSPLPKNLGFPVNKNKNKLVVEDLRPTDTRTNYKFKSI